MRPQNNRFCEFSRMRIAWAVRWPHAGYFHLPPLTRGLKISLGLCNPVNIFLFLAPVWLPESSVTCGKWKGALMLQISCHIPQMLPAPLSCSLLVSLWKFSRLCLVSLWFWNATKWHLPTFPFCEFSSLRSCALCNVCAAQITVSGSAFIEGLLFQSALLGAMRNQETS